MSEKDNFVPPLSFEIERQQAHIKRSLVIQACVRGTVRVFAEWLRSFVLRSTQLTRRLASKRCIYSDIRELQQFDDRMLADIGVTTDRSAQFDRRRIPLPIGRLPFTASLVVLIIGEGEACTHKSPLSGNPWLLSMFRPQTEPVRLAA